MEIPFFGPAGAHAFRKDVPDAEIHLFDTGHFALETHGSEIAALIRDFLSRKSASELSLGEERSRALQIGCPETFAETAKG